MRRQFADECRCLAANQKSILVNQFAEVNNLNTHPNHTQLLGFQQPTMKESWAIILLLVHVRAYSEINNEKYTSF